ncbi:DNA recombination protein RmuC [Spiroplasma endosymbiont of Amphibalanus improvisus]|uniref:DNA recombination protein RmuC n=1 Tax=Spiroplasma endosymbiont of Amphibalanus improvisus TaxID=3066327 RepID=UPI00313B9F76
MTDIISYIILVILLLIILIGGFYVFKNKSRSSKNIVEGNTDNSKLDFLNEKIKELNNSINDFKDKTHQNDLNKVAKLTDATGKLENNLQSIYELKQNIVDIKSIFISSKNRGNLGEYSLYKIIEDFLGAPNGKNWEKQSQITVDTNNSGYGNVDAVIFNGYKNILIDAKFPLENYSKYQKAAEQSESNKNEIKECQKHFEEDIKKKISEIKKYKKPGDNNVLIMFIPSESVFGFIMSNFQTLVVKNQNEVNFCSPTTLSLMLRLILEDDKKQNLIKNAEKIYKLINEISYEYSRLNERWNKVKQQLDKTTKSAKDLDITFEKIEKKSLQIERPNSNAGLNNPVNILE